MFYVTTFWSWTIRSFSLTTIRMVFRLFQLLLLFMFGFVVSWHMDNFDSTRLAIFEWIQIWECALNWFITEPIRKCFLDICHLRVLGATYPKHVILLIPCVQMIPTWSENLHDTYNTTYPNHLPLEFLVEHVLVSVNPCGRCACVTPLPQIAKLPKIK